MTMVPLTEHSIPQESLAYLVEDDNSYLRLEQDLSSDSPVDVIGDDTFVTHDTVTVPVFTKPTQLFSTSQHSNSLHSNHNPQHPQLSCSKAMPLNGVHPSCSKPLSRSGLQTHISCSKPTSLSTLQPNQLPCSKQQQPLQRHNLSCSKTNSPSYLTMSDQTELTSQRTAFPQLQSHVTSRDAVMTSRDHAVMTSPGQRTAFPQLQSISDHRFSLQKLLGFGTPEQQQNLRVLAGQRPALSRCISHINPHNNAPFQRSVPVVT